MSFGLYIKHFHRYSESPPEIVLKLFLNFNHLEPLCSYKFVLIKNRCVLHPRLFGYRLIGYLSYPTSVGGIIAK